MYRISIAPPQPLNRRIMRFSALELTSTPAKVAATRFKLEKFNGVTNFNLWQVRMMAILVQTGLKKVVIGKKPENLNQIKWEELDEKALFVIQLCLANTVQIDDEDQAMLLLCSLPPSYKSFRKTLIYGRDKLLLEDMKGHLLSRDKLDNEFGSASKVDRQASILVASKKRDKICRYCKKS
ncbi:hypothetical protein J1N35_022071 [Gossypium stocksii]|uniref:Retrovirus-related Pol polyprotein from transposon TNT 1-94 n=1 Tax=Gossypium stocksii TaxID=47602 RepID=A0A9D3VFE5_9ROSI|nr:hypothetical protein J1N35_022071 [Gossypium stocksii]